MTDKAQKATCFYLGKAYPLEITLDKQCEKAQVTFDGDRFTCMTSSEDLKGCEPALVTFYKRAAKQWIGDRIRYYEPLVGEKMKAFTIESDDTKWGTCSSKRNLTFHWKLMLYPAKAIDYVVVHELCHLRHLNHDRSFWRLIGKVYPEWKSAMALIGAEKTRSV